MLYICVCACMRVYSLFLFLWKKGNSQFWVLEHVLVSRLNAGFLSSISTWGTYRGWQSSLTSDCSGNAGNGRFQLVHKAWGLHMRTGRSAHAGRVFASVDSEKWSSSQWWGLWSMVTDENRSHWPSFSWRHGAAEKHVKLDRWSTGKSNRGWRATGNSKPQTDENVQHTWSWSKRQILWTLVVLCHSITHDLFLSHS